MRSYLQETKNRYAMLLVCFLTMGIFAGTAIAGGGTIIMPGREGGMVIGGPMDGTMVLPSD